MMLHAEKIDDKGETKAHRKMGRKMVLKQMGRFLGNSLTDETAHDNISTHLFKRINKTKIT